MRNHAKWECRKALNHFEKKLVKDSKTNPKAKYAKSKLKTKSGISNLARVDGSQTTTDKQEVDVLNNSQENIQTTCRIHSQAVQTELNDIEITPGDEAKRLSKMNPNKSTGPDGAAPRVLK